MTRFTFTGRLVQGSATEPAAQRKDSAGVLKFRKDGQPDRPFFMAIAIPKDAGQRFTIPGNPTFENEKANIDGAARAAWPQLFTGTRPPGLQFSATLPIDCTSPKFANKIDDGDGFDENGKPNSSKDGFAGCWIVKVQNGFAPACYYWENGWQEITPHSPVQIKCGDYVTISGTTSSNQSTQSPGMYANVDTVSFEQAGAAIISNNSVDPTTALGQRGAPANPPVSAPPAPAAPAATAGAPAPGAPPSTTAPAYSGYREAAPPAPPAGPQMTAAATYTYEQYRASGWTDEVLRAQGLIV